MDLDSLGGISPDIFRLPVSECVPFVAVDINKLDKNLQTQKMPWSLRDEKLVLIHRGLYIAATQHLYYFYIHFDLVGSTWPLTWALKGTLKSTNLYHAK